MHLFPSLPIPFCSSHTSPSLRLRCTTVVFLLSFSFYTFSILDPPFTLSRQSITLICAAYCFPFHCHAHFPYAHRHLTRLELILENRLYIHFVAQASQNFTLPRTRTRRTRDIDLREDLFSIYIHFQQSNYSSYRLPLRAI